MSAVPANTLDHPISLKAIEKESKLRNMMRGMGRVLVAYSGGVDSSYLAFIANAELSRDALCVLGVSPSVSSHQRGEAERTASEFGFNLRIVETNEIDDENYAANPTNRCYYCKTELYVNLNDLARAEKFEFVLDGTNFDDVGDHRPGRAAAAELGVRSPLVEAELTKDEIRELSRRHGLPSWDKPASPCLSSRIQYGIPVTIGRLSKIEKGEAILRDMGIREFRLRVHGDLARIEIAPAEMDLILERGTFANVAARIKELGFRFVTLDMEGFRSGAMNDAVSNKK